MLIDTDVLIWLFRGKRTAASLLDEIERVTLSSVTYMELVQGMRDKEEFRLLRQTIHDHGWQVLPLDENISHRATVYIENYALSHGLRMADALVAASAVESGLPLVTANRKHYRAIPDLTIRPYRP